MADIDVHYEPISIVNGPVAVEVKGLDDTKNKITLETPQPVRFETKSDVAVTRPIETESRFELATPEPIKTESRFELTTPEPIKADSKTELDVKPLAIDQCLRISLGPLPPTCVRMPIQQQIGFTIFGIEIVGLRFSGETQILVCDPAKEPHIAWGEVALAAKPPSDAPSPTAGEQQRGDSFRITLGGGDR